MAKLPIDFEQLVFSFEDEAPDNLYYLDLETGEVRLVHRELAEIRDLTDEIETDRERFLFIPKPDPKKRKDDFRDFIDTVDDAKLKTYFEMAMEGPHPHSGFMKILQSVEGGQARLREFLEGRSRVRVHQWLAANCLETDFEEAKTTTD